MTEEGDGSPGGEGGGEPEERPRGGGDRPERGDQSRSGDGRRVGGEERPGADHRPADDGRRPGTDHQFSAGEGFGDPYDGFDFDPTELTLELDPGKVDPTDTHVLPDLLDEAAIPADEVAADELVDVGLAYMGVHRYEQAAETFERAARFADDDATEQEAWTNKGTAHAELEEWDAAIGAFEEALHVAPKGEHAAVAETNLANALWEFGRDDEALEHAERAIERDERFAEAWYNRGFLLNERGLAEQALDSLENALRLGYRNADVLEEKRRALEALGEYDEAEAVAEEAEAMREALEEDLVG